MNSYGRLEINLLPPELLPGPVVRYAVLINVLIIFATLAVVIVNAYIGWTKLDLEKENSKALNAQIQAKRYIEEDYNRLEKIGNQLAAYGRLIALASMDYVDMPVVLDRLAKIMPDGVYIDSVYNRGSESGLINLEVNMKASQDDPRLVLATLRSMKKDEIFNNCYMPSAELKEESLEDLITQIGINWNATGPDINTSIYASQYEFSIHSRLPRPVGGSALPLLWDESGHFAALSGGAKRDGGLPSEDASAPPEGVTVEEVH
ncbi:hypothetical protein JW859_14705 [bacterium]|nr:hypothetical protein [bacterium]